MDVTEHRAAMVAAAAAVEAAIKAKDAIFERAAIELSPIKVGEDVPGKIMASGTLCRMRVTEVEASVGSSHVTLAIIGKKLNKDGSLSHIDAWSFCSIVM